MLRKRPDFFHFHQPRVTCVSLALGIAHCPTDALISGAWTAAVSCRPSVFYGLLAPISEKKERTRDLVMRCHSLANGARRTDTVRGRVQPYVTSDNKLCAWRHNMPPPPLLLRGRHSASRTDEHTQRSSTFPRPVRSHGHRCTCLTR